MGATNRIKKVQRLYSLLITKYHGVELAFCEAQPLCFLQIPVERPPQGNGAPSPHIHDFVQSRPTQAQKTYDLCQKPLGVFL